MKDCYQKILLLDTNMLKEIIETHRTSENLTIIESLMKQFNTEERPDNTKAVILCVEFKELYVCLTCNGSVDKVRNLLRDRIKNNALAYEKVMLVPHSFVFMDDKLYITYYVN